MSGFRQNSENLPCAVRPVNPHFPAKAENQSCNLRAMADGSSRRSFFGKVLGGLAVALGVKAAPSVFVRPDLPWPDSEIYERVYREIYGSTDVSADGWATSNPVGLKKGDWITIRGVWDEPRMIVGDVSA